MSVDLPRPQGKIHRCSVGNYVCPPRVVQDRQLYFEWVKAVQMIDDRLYVIESWTRQRFPGLSELEIKEISHSIAPQL